MALVRLVSTVLLGALAACSAQAQLGPAGTYLRDRLMEVELSELQEIYPADGLSSRLGIVLSPPMPLPGPGPLILNAPLRSAPPFIDLKGSTLIRVVMGANHRKLALHVTFNDREKCVPISAVLDSPRCLNPMPYAEQLFPDPSKPAKVIGTMCPKGGNRDVVVRVLAPDFKCVRGVSIANE